MTALELKARVYQQIAHLDDAQLQKLCKLLDQEFSLSASQGKQKRTRGKYKGQFIIKDDFDQLPDAFVVAFTKD